MPGSVRAKPNGRATRPRSSQTPMLVFDRRGGVLYCTICEQRLMHCKTNVQRKIIRGMQMIVESDRVEISVDNDSDSVSHGKNANYTNFMDRSEVISEKDIIIIKKLFVDNEYLTLNKDVASANVDAFNHFIDHGIVEGRPRTGGMIFLDTGKLLELRPVSIKAISVVVEELVNAGLIKEALELSRNKPLYPRAFFMLFNGLIAGKSYDGAANLIDNLIHLKYNIHSIYLPLKNTIADMSSLCLLYLGREKTDNLLFMLYPNSDISIHRQLLGIMEHFSDCTGLIGVDLINTRSYFIYGLQNGNSFYSVQAGIRLFMIENDAATIEYIQDELLKFFISAEKLRGASKSISFVFDFLSKSNFSGAYTNKYEDHFVQNLLRSLHQYDVSFVNKISDLLEKYFMNFQKQVSSSRLAADLRSSLSSNKIIKYHEIKSSIENLVAWRNSGNLFYCLDSISTHLQEHAFRHSESARFDEAIKFYAAAVPFGVSDLQALAEAIRNNIYSAAESIKTNSELNDFFALVSENKWTFYDSVQLLKIDKISDFAKNHGCEYYEIIGSRTGVEPEIKIIPSNVKLNSAPGYLDYPAFQVARLGDVFARANTNGYISNGILVYDKLCESHATRAWFGDMVDSGGSLSHGSPFIIAHDTHRAIVRVQLNTDISFDSAIALFGVQSRNYGHWFLEYLPRIVAFERAKIPGCVPYIINKGLPSTILRSLDILNVSRRPVVEIEDYQCLYAKSLYVSAPPAYFPLDVKRGEPAFDTIWPEDVLREVRSEVLSAVTLHQSKTKYGKFIYISGRYQASRKIVDEDKIEKFLINKGFEVVFPELLSFDEQVKLFNNAKIVIGATKSSFANTIFCTEKCLVIGLSNDTSDFNYRGYASFTEASGAEIIFIQGVSVLESSHHRFHRDFLVDLTQLEAVIDDKIKNDIIKELNNVENKERLANDLLHYFKIINHDAMSENMVRTALDKGVDYLTEFLSGVEKSVPLFDIEFYKAKYLVNKNVNALLHYILIGRYDSVSTSPLFNTNFYLESNPDIREANVDPLLHYIQHGMLEGRIGVDIGSIKEKTQDIIWLKDCYKTYHAINIINTIACYRGELWAIEGIMYKCKNYPGAYQTNIWSVYLLEEEGRLEDAIRLCSMFTEVFNHFWFIHEYYGLLQRRAGRNSIAAAAFERARTLDPDNEKIKTLIREINEHQLSSEIEPSLQISTDESNKNSILLFDTCFPDSISSFRFGEFDSYVRNVQQTIVRSSNWDVRTYGGETSFQKIIDKYCVENLIDLNRVKSFGSEVKLSAASGYTVFLNNVTILMSKNIFDIDRFGFTLYPGGGFDLERRVSQSKLERVISDERLEYIVTTQNITFNYLTKNFKYPKDRIVHIFGGVVPSLLLQQNANERIYRSKPTIDICFVAQKYSALGIEKGYDIFAKVMKRLKNDKRFIFHVVGGFDFDTIDLNGAENVIFYGRKPRDFFPDFYRQMDIFVSPNISRYELHGAGSFDGFPTTAAVEAGAEGVALFLTDTLNLNMDLDGNSYLQDGIDFLKVNRNDEEIVEKLISCFNDQDKIRKIGLSGKKRLEELYSYESQMLPRIFALKNRLLR